MHTQLTNLLKSFFIVTCIIFLSRYWTDFCLIKSIIIMNTHRISTEFPIDSSEIHAYNNNLWLKYLSFVDSQKEYAAAWWIGSLMLQSILVPLTFLFVWSLNGHSLPFLFISMVCFFINVIANMSGAAFRFIFNSFILSIAIHALIIITTVIAAL